MNKLKITVVLAFLCVSGKIHSQITDLSELFTVSSYTVQELIIKLQGTWTIKDPIETVTREVMRDKYEFTYTDGKSQQILQRRINTHVSSGFKQEFTTFISNDKDLLSKLIKSLPGRGYALAKKSPELTKYRKGSNSVSIVNDAFKEGEGKKGDYMIFVFLH